MASDARGSGEGEVPDVLSSDDTPSIHESLSCGFSRQVSCGVKIRHVEQRVEIL